MDNRSLNINKKNISEKIVKFIAECETEVSDIFAELNDIEIQNEAKVLSAFQKNRIELRHFAPSSGYGYDDTGRDTLERLFADVFKAEDALVRPMIASGTHALSLALFGVLKPGDAMLSLTGTPYDTLREAIGIVGDEFGSLRHYGIGYHECDLVENKIDIDATKKKLSEHKEINMIYIQRSRGYSWRNSLTVEEIEIAIREIKKDFPGLIAMVDNCYGEFSQEKEPIEIGADLIAGSLIKNPGGSIAPSGGYIAGKSELISRVANRMTSPGIGREIGSYFASYQPFYQGLFMAPHVSIEAEKGAILSARIFEKLGYETLPKSRAKRGDIIQAIKFNSPELLKAFCRSIQAASPIDSHVVPEAWDMPGYNEPVIMAAGAFVQGASIELSADGPIREPYIAYLQGGVYYNHVKLAMMLSLEKMLSDGMISIEKFDK